MLHLRILVPAELTPAVQALLHGEPGAVHLSVVRGAAFDPSGDLIEADVEHASLTALVSRLEDLGVHERGSLSFSDVIDARSSAADTARRLTRSVGSELISWDEVAARTRDDTLVTPAYLLLMTIAGVIAAGGILTNNELLIVGAMIVSPDYGPLAGFCVAALAGPPVRARSSAWALLVGFMVAAGSAAVVAGAAAIGSLVPALYVAGDRPVTELIAEPNAASLLVALAAGVAGMIALGQAKSGAVVGVLVSVTTIPAAANVGVALALGNLDEAYGAVAQLLINLAGLVIAGVGSLWIGRRLSRRRAIAEIRRRRQDRRDGP
ncbi:MAG: DUF389 domain-containing protein [Candidatus Limnocylindrales bacterium]